MVSFIDEWGRSFIHFFRLRTESLLFFYFTLRSTLLLKWSAWVSIFHVLISQIYFTGVLALPLMTFIALCVGSIVVMQSNAHFSVLGSQEMMGNILVVIIVRELGPLLTALIVIARSGTAVASELGNMKVNREIEALRVMGINPLGYVVFPRLLGGVIGLVCLSFYFNSISLWGGFLVANYATDLTFSFYLDALSLSLNPQDIFLNLFKNIMSGAIIFTISCEEGLRVKQGPHEVPVATTKSVVNSIVWVMAFNLLVSGLLFMREIQ